MGSICTNNFQKEEGTQTIDTYKNAVQYEVQLGQNCTLAIVLGHYRQHRSEALLLLVERNYIQHCEPLRQYTTDPDKTLQIITNMRKTFYKPMANKACPYKKLLIGVLPHYLSEESESYQQQFKKILHEVFDSTREVTLELANTVENIRNLPNQMILGVLLQEVMKMHTPFKLNLITTEKKMMNLYKYELIKTEQFVIKSYQE